MSYTQTELHSNIDNVNIMDSAGGEIDWMGFSRDIGKGEAASRYSEQMDIPFPCGGAVMIRRDALPDPSRLFWEDLFIYQEDLDLGFELVRTGCRIVYEPKAIVRHMHSATTGRGSFFKEHLCIRNRLLVLRKHFDTDTFEKLDPIIRRWQHQWLVVSVARGRFTLAKSILKGTKDGLSMPVVPFTAPKSINEVFVRYAKENKSAGKIKSMMYKQVREIIKGTSGEFNE